MKSVHTALTSTEATTAAAATATRSTPALVTAPTSLGTATVVIALEAPATATEASGAVVKSLVGRWACLAALLVVLLDGDISLFALLLGESHFIQKLARIREHIVGYGSRGRDAVR